MLRVRVRRIWLGIINKVPPTAVGGPSGLGVGRIHRDGDCGQRHDGDEAGHRPFSGNWR